MILWLIPHAAIPLVQSLILGIDRGCSMYSFSANLHCGHSNWYIPEKVHILVVPSGKVAGHLSLTGTVQ